MKTRLKQRTSRFFVVLSVPILLVFYTNCESQFETISAIDQSSQSKRAAEVCEFSGQSYSLGQEVFYYTEAGVGCSQSGRLSRCRETGWTPEVPSQYVQTCGQQGDLTCPHPLGSQRINPGVSVGPLYREPEMLSTELCESSANKVYFICDGLTGELSPKSNSNLSTFCEAKPIHPVPAGAQLEKVTSFFDSEFRFLEGPIFSRSLGILFFSDQATSRTYQFRPEAREVSVWREGTDSVNGRALLRGTTEMIIARGGQGRNLSRIHLGTQNETLIASHYLGSRLNQPNDVALGPGGGIYFTDPDWNVSGAQKELSHNGVYRVSSSGDIDLLDSQLLQPNGLTFSPDLKILYVSDNGGREPEQYHHHFKVYRYSVSEAGFLSEKTLFIDLAKEAPEWKSRSPIDGMTVDQSGNLYVIARHGVWIISPDGGVLDRIDVNSNEPPTNVTFGGADMKTLFVTTQKGLYQIQLNIPGVVP